MNTVQEPLTDSIPPFPFFIENHAELNRAELPANKASINSNPSSVELDTNPLPDRCQFTFSDGRQCRMGRSEIHPSLCRFHAEREDQLFGDPAPGGNVVGAALDLPELHSACRDLTTATGVNRALAQVFRLLAQRRISRQEAATFGHLAQLLLRTISAMRADLSAANVYHLPQKGHQQDALFAGDKDELRGVNKVELPPVNNVKRDPRDLSASPPVNKVQRERTISPQLSPVNTIEPERGISPAPPPVNNVKREPPISPEHSPIIDISVEERPLREPVLSPDYQTLRSRSLGVVHAASAPNAQVSQNEDLPNFST